jgi:2'-5' RNA ligase
VTSGASVGVDARPRLFLALELPDHVRAGLHAWAAPTFRSGRRVARDDLHVTLAFLGSRPAGEVDAIVSVLRECASGSGRCPLAVSGWRETRSVGMLVLDDPTGAAGRLAAALHGRLESLGVYRRERRAWLPHVTVVRFAERPRVRPPLPAMGTFVPSDAAAYVSRLHPSGARYDVLARVPLDPMESRRMRE